MHTIIDFNVKGDERGNLVALEQFSGCPFDIKRVYYIWGTLKGVVRGKHAHKDLEQIIICVSGSCDFILDDGVSREIIHLDTPKKGLYIKNKVWREFTNFSKDCVVMVLASERYNPEDYINDYEEFIKEVRTNK
ncbi:MULTISPECIES: sugar 3,4-ketoisomerase [Gilliamella]|uniref:sugar 3,4-ketoisomerase n=1 Tax=Gilliamella TaxID=1193503 RepID=UPI000A343BA1|nr:MULTISPECIES: FdtA/QdtA family cupin domain-containing protein [Gilliamella]MBI0112876.1 WxcM-like domain-containing protein [Gilliamella sp. W8123]MBI0118347.1 WxcM-like domain-containing protein [Gilliamella sp. W8129]MBI0156089.1 WxcM-like domain-containing protein [Gilliamella sp. M0364]OTQ55363.1 dTDP-6-deoxy-3,4-keto-hexulose isomerase [Gilliamella apis]OTQ75780.1 dTDP-6-deoxy-3,4-keto-hexulose isomerase [Gilliamella apis]